MYLAAS